MEISKEEIDRFKELLENTNMNVDEETHDAIEELNRIYVNTKLKMILITLEGDTQGAVYETAYRKLQKYIEDKKLRQYINTANLRELKQNLPKYFIAINNQDIVNIIIICYSNLLDSNDKSDTEWEAAKRIFVNCIILSNNERGREIATNITKKNLHVLENSVTINLVMNVQSIADIILGDFSAYESLIPILLREIKNAFLNLHLEKQNIINNVFQIILELIPVPNEYSNISEVIECLQNLIKDNSILFKELIIATTKKLLSIINYNKTSDSLQTELIGCIANIFENNEDCDLLKPLLLPDITKTFSQLLFRKYINHNWFNDIDEDLRLESYFERIIHNLLKSEKYIIIIQIFESLFNTDAWNDQAMAFIMLNSISKVRTNEIKSSLSVYLNRIFKLMTGKNIVVLFNSINTIDNLMIFYKEQFSEQDYKNIFEEICIILNTHSNLRYVYNRCLSLLNHSIEHSSQDIIKIYHDRIISFLNVYYKNTSNDFQTLYSLNTLRSSLYCTRKLLLAFQSDDLCAYKDIAINLLSIGRSFLSYTNGDIYIYWLDCIWDILRKQYFDKTSIVLDFMNLVTSIDFNLLKIQDNNKDVIIYYLIHMENIYKRQWSPMPLNISTISTFYSFLVKTMSKVSNINLETTLRDWKNNISSTDELIIDKCLSILAYLLHYDDRKSPYLDELFHISTLIYCNTNRENTSIISKVLIEVIEFDYSPCQNATYKKFQIILKCFFQVKYTRKYADFINECTRTISVCICSFTKKNLYHDIIMEFITFFNHISENIIYFSCINENSNHSMSSDFQQNKYKSLYIYCLINMFKELNSSLSYKLESRYIEYFRKLIDNICNIYFIETNNYNFKLPIIKICIPFIQYATNESLDIFENVKEFIKIALSDINSNTYNECSDFVEIAIELNPRPFQDLFIYLIDFFNLKFHTIIDQKTEDNEMASDVILHIGMLMKFQPHLISNFQSILNKWIDLLIICEDFYEDLIQILLDIMQNKLEINYVLNELQIYKAFDKIFLIMSYTDFEVKSNLQFRVILTPLKLTSPGSFKNWYDSNCQFNQQRIDTFLSDVNGN